MSSRDAAVGCRSVSPEREAHTFSISYDSIFAISISDRPVEWWTLSVHSYSIRPYIRILTICHILQLAVKAKRRNFCMVDPYVLSN